MEDDLVIVKVPFFLKPHPSSTKDLYISAILDAPIHIHVQGSRKKCPKQKSCSQTWRETVNNSSRYDKGRLCNLKNTIFTGIFG